MVDSVVLRTRKVLSDLLVSQEDCDIIFNLKDNVVLKAHSSILSAHSSKFKVESRDCPLVFIMDPRIEHSVMWIVLTYMYTGVDYDIQPQQKDSYILVAYFFDEKKIILDADDYLVKSISIMTAVKLFHYSIEMKMSYKCKARIFNYIAKFVMKLPEFFTLDSVLMTPDVLSCAYNCYIEGKDKECPYSAPADETEAAGTMSAVVECFEDSNPAPDVLYEQIEEQLYVVGNAEHDDLFEQIEELLDVVGTSEKEAAASRSRHYHRNSGSDFEFF